MGMTFSTPLRFLLIGVNSIQFSTQGDLVQNSSPPVQGTERINAGSIPMNRMEVVVHTFTEQHETLRTRDGDSCNSTVEKMHGILNGLGCNHEDMGRAV